MGNILETLKTFLGSTGIAKIADFGDVVEILKLIAMFAIVGVLVYLAIAKKFEPLLLLPIAIGMLLGNLPGTEMFHMDLFISKDTSAVLEETRDFMAENGYIAKDGLLKIEIDDQNNVTNSKAVISEMGLALINSGLNPVMDDASVYQDFTNDSLSAYDVQYFLNSFVEAIEKDGKSVPKSLKITIHSLTVNGEGPSMQDVAHYGGLLDLLYLGVKLGIYPCLIFIGIGAMTDFGPLIANPKSLLLGAAAQLGVFVAFIGAIIFGFTPQEAASIGIIGGADGPTAILVTKTLAPHLLGAIAIAAE